MRATAGGVVAADVFDFALLVSRDQYGGHNASHGMGRIVLGVFTASVAVVVFDQVFKDGGVEVEFLRKNSLKTELH